ncbi:hypothetical protein LMG19083_04862 [Ralstonia psammae]|uniref:Uncharacterized protein n=1 Tax=Ralstonia psammae TaxID=3058598 RepID=A0ABN9JHX1_9RALS|nr:hypothetical protein [Ralstonia sp. LMG 19083]CAJ0809156.1 hypothetical protein LMG19083_04862 [Ralstonia sp. LMG 19083]
MLTRSIAQRAPGQPDRSGPRAWRAAHLIALKLAAVLAVLGLALSDALAQNPAPTVLANAARTVGIRQCYSAVEQIAARVVGAAPQQDVVLDWDHAAPDAAPFFALSGFVAGAGPEVMTLATVPNERGTCAVLAERITPSPLACPVVATRELAGYRGTALVPGVQVYANPNRPHETVTLITAKPACLVLRRQVEYRWPGAPR